ncbi:CopY/TcrY family copper transport repressor [Alkalibacterium iburiense]|uniref:CopY/TcrY family copper transport repressor n=1 Tax=Alkalibacterium iburiense TaxID=290589 RepID=A0ABN0XST4_9LACT
MKENQISPAEWEIMRVVWTTHPITSTEIYNILQEKTNWKLPTTKTLIGRLVKKGMLTTQTKGRKYEYSPAVTEKQSIKETTDALLEQVCSTKVGQTIEVMLENSVLSQDDLASLEQLIEEKKKTAPEVVACNCTPGQCDCRHEGGK